MRLRSFSLACIFTLGTASPAAALADAAPAFSEQEIRADVGFLADDLLEGRDAGTRGYNLAARYVAARFEALGLGQAVPGSWYQPVTLSVAQLEQGTKPALTIGGRRFDNGGDVAIGASGREPAQSLEAPAVFVGYGLKSEREKIDDYAGLDLKGKFAVALSGSPLGMPSEIGAHLAAEKTIAAEQAGAVGLIFLPSDGQLSRTPWARLRERVTVPSVSWVNAEGQPYARAPGIRGTAYVNGAAAEALLAGSGRSLAMIRAQAAVKGGNPRGFPLKPMVKLERNSSVTTAASRNVLALLPGSDPMLAREYVLLMAHLDHLGMKDKGKGKDGIYNGAMDNASGVATLLAVAKALSDNGARLKR
ncbi:MAG TPA: M28 family peptidase, partial [Sphingobium sp.]|nr:M28 family peptidase [Sphingobium sp.]